MGEWRLPITELRRQLDIVKKNNKATVNVIDLETVLNNMEDDFEIQDKFTTLEKINNPRLEYDKNLDHYIKYLKEVNTEYRNYTQLVITAGYATYFGLWTISNNYLEPFLSSISFLLIIASVVSFIFLEVTKIGLDGFNINIKNKALLLARIEDDLDTRVKKLEFVDKYKNRFDLWISRIWIVTYPISFICGLGAVFILGYAIVKSVLENFSY